MEICYDCKSIKQDFEFAIGGGVTVGGNGVAPVFINFLEPDQFNIDFYGAAKRGSVWKGGRMVYQD